MLAKIADDLLRRDGRMERKHVLMPASLVRHVEAMANEAHVTFAEIVRRALRSYSSDAHEENSDVTLERLAEALIRSNEETVTYLDKVNKRLDKTHAELAKRRHGVAR